MHSRGAANPDDQRANQRDLDRTHAPDRHDGEGQHDHLHTDAERHRNLRRHHRTAQCTQHRADDKGHAVNQRDVDAESGRRFTVIDDRREQLAVALEHECPIGGKCQSGGNRHQHHVVVGQDQAAQLCAAGRNHRLKRAVGLRAPDQHDDVFEDQERGISDEHDDHFVPAIDQPQQPALKNDAHDQADQHRENDHEQEAKRRRPVAIRIDTDRRRRTICAESVERAMRDVQYFHDAEDQRQADGHDKEIGRVNEAVGEDGSGCQHVQKAIQFSR